MNPHNRKIRMMSERAGVCPQFLLDKDEQCTIGLKLSANVKINKTLDNRFVK